MGHQSDSVIAVIVIFFVLSWLTVGLRMYTRTVLNKSFGIDDVFIFVMQIFYTAYLVSQIQGWRHGIGRHESELTPEDRKLALMYWFICSLLYIVCVGLFKISLGFFLLRIAVDRFHVLTLQFFTWGTVVAIVAYFFISLFQCNPPSAFWIEGPRTAGKCYSDSAVLGIDIAASIINCIADWTYGILPLFIVRNLNMRSRTKWLVMAILSFAAVGSIATFVRIFYLPTLTSGDDFLYASTVVTYLSTVECGVGITAVSIGTLKPLWELWRGNPGSTTANSNSQPWTPRTPHWPPRTPGSSGRMSYVRTGDGDNDTAIGLQSQVETNASKTSGSTTLVSNLDMSDDSSITKLG